MLEVRDRHARRAVELNLSWCPARAVPDADWTCVMWQFVVRSEWTRFDAR
jgi:hypothetical protein